MNWIVNEYNRLVTSLVEHERNEAWKLNRSFRNIRINIYEFETLLINRQSERINEPKLDVVFSLFH